MKWGVAIRVDIFAFENTYTECDQERERARERKHETVRQTE